MAGAEAYLPLLRMSIGLQGRNGDQPAAEPVQEMDPERKEWLKDAMANVLKNPVDDMKVALKQITESEASEDAKVQALESLVGFVEQIDLARDLHKIGGLATVIALLDDPSHRVRASAAQVIGTTVHNNPEPQKWATELGALDALTKVLTRPDASPLELAKAMYGVSSLIRQNDAATIRYVKELKGVAIILDVMKRDSHSHEDLLPARRKAAFMLLYLITRAPAIVPVTAPHCVPVLTSALSAHAEDSDFRENVLMILRVYSTNDAVKLAAEDKKQIKETTAKTMEIAKKDEHDTAVELCQEILAIWRIR